MYRSRQPRIVSGQSAVRYRRTVDCEVLKRGCDAQGKPKGGEDPVKKILFPVDFSPSPVPMALYELTENAFLRARVGA